MNTKIKKHKRPYNFLHIFFITWKSGEIDAQFYDVGHDEHRVRRMEEVEKLDVGAKVDVVEEEQMETSLAVGEEDSKIEEA